MTKLQTVDNTRRIFQDFRHDYSMPEFKNEKRNKIWKDISLKIMAVSEFKSRKKSEVNEIYDDLLELIKEYKEINNIEH